MRPFPTKNLEDLLEAGVTLGVQRSSSLEGNFREATSGAFQSAWKIMRNSSKHFVKNRGAAVPVILADDHFAYFDSQISMAGTKEYQACLISAIPAK